jgi:hypothetical protein
MVMVMVMVRVRVRVAVRVAVTLQCLDGVYHGLGERQWALERNAIGCTHGSTLQAEQRRETQ